MDTTTIKIYQNTKQDLDKFREYKNESYDEVIKKLLFITKNIELNIKLSKETLKAVSAARKRITSGKFLTESEAKKRLGL
jgi:hypothetical protein